MTLPLGLLYSMSLFILLRQSACPGLETHGLHYLESNICFEDYKS
ncbi:MAG TPA: hypothetical protein VKN82_04010 [Desulfohalobiaceae bacterium]|nr:hypothetical protein [Desulfohalobiaceae bacterium]